ncbi:D-alanine--D-alanine ligase [Helicobacter trogontum]|uniref:D-alanine--D-alanine ligase n=1 Tax=Helicobacter trogontum TaxID=50960 RepID=A0A4U8TFQ1_9HELI|nr:D-alanine--D-alanine ligase [Helicobacter trogontum]MCI5785963.1 D-alanine--D-alanine ligase [Helicobacter trogontum]MDY5185320.1 D-alanine--D-alanine ligase [Helicobacter trogontum]TLD98941.1 D-alanine--D-alanine ligase [Helicobacter trogontum]
MNLSIIFGGVSYEHEISIVSAITMAQKLGRNIKITHFIFLDSNHDFYLIESNNMKSKYFSTLSYKQAKKIEIGMGGFYEIGFLGKKKLLHTGLLLNLIHGGDGEDGVLSGLFDFYKITYIGPRLEASMLSYNKKLTKFYAKECGVETLPYYVLRRNEDCKIPFEPPYIIKPTCLGSSIGVCIVEDSAKLSYGLDCAFEFSDEVIIEPFKKGIKEYNLAGTKVKDDFILSLIEEPIKKDLLGFDDKYLDFSRTEEVKSAEITESLTNKLHEEFKKIYNTIFEGALIRCDFFVSEDKIYLNEINPIPGSMANYLFPDFESVLEKIATSLPRKHAIKINYQYINQIQHAKGK